MVSVYFMSGDLTQIFSAYFTQIGLILSSLVLFDPILIRNGLDTAKKYPILSYFCPYSWTFWPLEHP